MSATETPAPAPPAPARGAAAGPTAAPQGLGWVERYQGLAVGIAFVLLLFYVLPVLLIGLVAIQTRGFQADHMLFEWFATFVRTADSTLNEFHKILLPIVTAISVIAFRARPSRWMLLLGLFMLVAFVATVFVDVLFQMPRTEAAMKGLSASVDQALAKTFFARIEETLMMYLMTLLGIGVANAAKDKP